MWTVLSFRDNSIIVGDVVNIDCSTYLRGNGHGYGVINLVMGEAPERVFHFGQILPEKYYSAIKVEGFDSQKEKEHFECAA